MDTDGMDNIDAALAALRQVQDDETASPEAAEAARLAELALLRLLDVLLADEMRGPLLPLPTWLPDPRDEDDGEVIDGPGSTDLR